MPLARKEKRYMLESVDKWEVLGEWRVTKSRMALKFYEKHLNEVEETWMLNADWGRRKGYSCSSTFSMKRSFGGLRPSP